MFERCLDKFLSIELGVKNCICISIILGLISSFFLSYPISDNLSYIELANNLLHGHGYLQFSQPASFRYPGVAILYLPILLFTSSPFLALKSLFVLTYIPLGLAYFFLLKKVDAGLKPYSILLSLIFILSLQAPIILTNMGSITHHVHDAFYFLCVALIVSNLNTKNARVFFIAGLVSAVAVLVRIPSIAECGWLTLCIALFSKGSPKEKIIKGTVFFIPVIAAVVLWTVYVYCQTGRIALTYGGNFHHVLLSGYAIGLKVYPPSLEFQQRFDDLFNFADHNRGLLQTLIEAPLPYWNEIIIPNVLRFKSFLLKPDNFLRSYYVDISAVIGIVLYFSKRFARRDLFILFTAAIIPSLLPFISIYLDRYMSNLQLPIFFLASLPIAFSLNLTGKYQKFIPVNFAIIMALICLNFGTSIRNKKAGKIIVPQYFEEHSSFEINEVLKHNKNVRILIDHPHLGYFINNKEQILLPKPTEQVLDSFEKWADFIRKNQIRFVLLTNDRPNITENPYLSFAEKGLSLNAYERIYFHNNGPIEFSLYHVKNEPKSSTEEKQ